MHIISYDSFDAFRREFIIFQNDAFTTSMSPFPLFLMRFASCFTTSGSAAGDSRWAARADGERPAKDAFIWRRQPQAADGHQRPGGAAARYRDSE